MIHLHRATLPIWTGHTLPFVLVNERRNGAKSSLEVCSSGGKFGLNERQSTIQLSIFANGIPSLRPA